ncbi:sugar phosphate isomerase/epimerase family protein [Trinickia diaoshuihuensis]|uniref:sugar phosphate isomerase/epimerase family protein n=1 Tax=Trinickia diaoshuihuensis TaxID=2292265 RepID=UPI000E247383|nr:sugar phosphate isomerase/epimerase [Trinickia diaoshuihuensis]
MNFRTSPELTLAHSTILETTPLDLATLASTIGYTSIDLRLHPPFPGSTHYQLAAGSPASRQTVSHLRNEGIEVRSIESVGIGRNFDVSQIEPLLEAGSVVGAKSLTVLGDDPDAYRLTENFARVCELAMPFALGVELQFMPWRQVASFDDALDIVIAAAQSNGSVLVDALHLWRSGGSALDVCAAPPGTVRSVQLCDAGPFAPASMHARITENRSGRLVPGKGTLPLPELLAELPEGTAISLAVPMTGVKDPERHARDVFESTQRLIESTLEAVR